MEDKNDRCAKNSPFSSLKLFSPASHRFDRRSLSSPLNPISKSLYIRGGHGTVRKLVSGFPWRIHVCVRRKLIRLKITGRKEITAIIPERCFVSLLSSRALFDLFHGGPFRSPVLFQLVPSFGKLSPHPRCFDVQFAIIHSIVPLFFSPR